MKAIVLALILTVVAGVARAAKPTEKVLFLDLGNDIIGFQNSDQHLTSSLSAGAVTTDVADILKKILMGKGNSTYSVSINQDIYTPENSDVPELLPDERPYAAWLFVRAKSITRDGNSFIIHGYETGVVGPSAYGEELQDYFHDVFDSDEIVGWDNQKEDQFGMNAFHRRGFSFRSGYKWVSELIVHGGATVGNVNTHVDAGGVYRFGYQVPHDQGGPLIDNGSLGLMNDNKPWHAYVFAGHTTRYVIHDEFLESEEHNIEAEEWIRSLKTGIVVGVRNFQMGYVNTRVSEQFDQQKKPDDRGTFFLRFHRKLH